MMHKYEIAAHLGRFYGLRSYVEICTPTTGYEFEFVDSMQFPRRVRCMYYCPENWSDSAPVHYRTEAPTSTKLPKIEQRFDLVFLDAWHEYRNVIEDITLSLSLVKPGGLVLLHDCNPKSEEIAAEALPAECAPGRCDRPWSGSTYVAFLDSVLGNGDLDYMTVDDDHGCGIISKDRRFPGDRPGVDLVTFWKALLPVDRYPFFDKHRVELLRLKSPAKFIEYVGDAHG